MSVGSKLLSIRKGRNMSQEQFGELFHVTRQTVSNWEKDKNFPDLCTLIDISDRFGVSLDELIKGDGNKMAGRMDRERKYSKAFRAAAAILAAITALAGVGVAAFVKSFEATPYSERNISHTAAAMYLNFPNATPSRAIVRTLELAEYEKLTEVERARLRDAVGGNIEGDIPCLRLDEGGTVRPVFQNGRGENVVPDSAPEIVLKRYGGGMLPEYDSSYQGEPEEWRWRLERDGDGYCFTLDGNHKSQGSALDVCMLEVFYAVEGRGYVSVSAFNLAD